MAIFAFALFTFSRNSARSRKCHRPRHLLLPELIHCSSHPIIIPQNIQGPLYLTHSAKVGQQYFNTLKEKLMIKKKKIKFGILIPVICSNAYNSTATIIFVYL